MVALTTLTSVANAYFQVLASQDRIRTAERNIASATRVLEAIKQRFKAGTGTDLDVAQQEAVARQSKGLGAAASANAGAEHQRLGDAGSRPPESVHVTGGSLNAISSPRVTPGLPSELLTQRPDIRRQEAQLASATANVGSARAQFFPSIQLTGQGGYQSSALVSLFQPHAAFFSMVGSLTQPIFDGGRILGNFEFTKARQDELLQTYRKTVVSAFADVDNALVAIKETTAKAAAAARGGGGFAAGFRTVRAATSGRDRGHRDCAKYPSDAISGGRCALAGAARPIARRGQPLSGAGRRVGAEDGEAGQCSLSRI